MSWIQIISPEAASGELASLYKRVAPPGARPDNILLVHSLRPHTLYGHMALYKNVLHHAANTIPKWFLETIGVYVSQLNRCDYCVTHHFAGLQKLLQHAPGRADQIMNVLLKGKPADAFNDKELLLLDYARKLTKHPELMQQEDVLILQQAGIPDMEILEVNQVVAYFCYANRTVLGLGVTLDGDVPGMSPGNTDDPEDWGHH